MLGKAMLTDADLGSQKQRGQSGTLVYRTVPLTWKVSLPFYHTGHTFGCHIESSVYAIINFYLSHFCQVFCHSNKKKDKLVLYYFALLYYFGSPLNWNVEPRAGQTNILPLNYTSSPHRCMLFNYFFKYTFYMNISNDIKYFYRLQNFTKAHLRTHSELFHYYWTAKIFVTVINSYHEYSYTLNKICRVGAVHRHACRSQ